ncbi:protein-glutamate O-methyltransferase CheR [Shewanella intestini]|uniref:Chemotaxis protein methyltransferase n=2 Tax=Shewanellaceae TaxID=267890 RepID=A0ABS5I214_9GAMM|nr:protein-glutamate O-methyltransferase CheR [Shewanella intestini]MRG36539.1 methyltransferase [Shewanella sp. XMDDZSB0408]
MSMADFSAIRQLAYEHTGIVLTERKHHMVYARLSRRIRALKLASFAQYVALLNTQTANIATTNQNLVTDSSDNNNNAVKHHRFETSELPAFINALTTNLTYFFREPHHFDYLKNIISPQWLTRKNKRLRIWSAGCSSGEEAYSIAMTLAMPFAHPPWDLKILATDVDSNVLNTAQQGRYHNDNRGVIPTDFVSKYVHSQADEYFTFTPEISQLVHVKPLNLLSSWPMKGPFDVIFCRNVFIYFDNDTKRQILAQFHQLLAPDGYLIIGHSETLIQLSEHFTFIGQTIYQPRSTAAPATSAANPMPSTSNDTLLRKPEHD